MRVLLITGTPPEMMVGGGAAATRSFINLFSAAPLHAEVDVCCLRPSPPRLPHRLRQFIALLRSCVSRLSAKTLYALPAGGRAQIAAKLRGGHYDVVAINGSDLFVLADQVPAAVPVVGLAQNIETALYASQVRQLAALPLLGRWFAREVAKLAAAERAGSARVRNIVCLSARDAEHFSTLADNIRILVQPTTFDYAPYTPAPQAAQRPLRLAFLAKYSWWPNVEALEWLVENVINKLDPGEVELLLFGPGAERFARIHPSVVVRGYASDLTEIWREGDFVVCPAVVGFGINIKFVEAIYNGVPVLATSCAANGLELTPDPAIRILDDATEWLAFLRSDEALQFASLTPRATNRERYGQAPAAERFAIFLRDIDAAPDAPAEQARPNRS